MVSDSRSAAATTRMPLACALGHDGLVVDDRAVGGRVLQSTPQTSFAV